LRAGFEKVGRNEAIMNDINKEEMFGNLKNFLKTKGIEIQDGSYADGIRKGCEILTDTVNLSQRALVRAKGAVDKGLDHVRQTVHERTAPKTKNAARKTAPEDGKTRAKARAEKPGPAKRGKKRSP
jgi:hypothetical protein